MNRHVRPAFISLYFCVPLCAAAVFEQPPTSQITIPASLDLARLLDLVSLRLHISVDYDPANPQLKGQQVTLRQPGPAGSESAGGGMSDQELWAAVSRLLVQRGLTTVRGPASTSFSVTKLEDAGKLARVEPAVFVDGSLVDGAAGTGPAGDGPVAGFRNQPVRLRYVSLKEAADALRSVQRPGGAPAQAVRRAERRAQRPRQRAIR
ncbi:MAG: hypothetical protein QM783_05055 [Phycisphaerales bacterium]